jgi:mannose-6-phosphate isomerase-like protein (cupin superfamily)
LRWINGERRRLFRATIEAQNLVAVGFGRENLAIGEETMEKAIPGERETWREGVETRMLVAASNGSRELCMFEQWVAPGTGAPTHLHPVEEVLTVLAGSAEVWVDEERFPLSAGQSAIVPARSRHGFSNTGTGPLHVRAILASAHFEASYEGRSEVVKRWQR